MGYGQGHMTWSLPLFDLDDDLEIGNHHRHATEQRLQVLREFLSTSVPLHRWVHCDEETTSFINLIQEDFMFFRSRCLPWIRIVIDVSFNVPSTESVHQCLVHVHSMTFPALSRATSNSIHVIRLSKSTSNSLYFVECMRVQLAIESKWPGDAYSLNRIT